MASEPGASPPNPATRARTSLQRSLTLGVVLAACGVTVATTIAWVHARIDASGSDYTSFCNLSSQVNCDLVLRSPFAKLAGIPIAWLAIVAYAGIAALLLVAARRPGARGRRALRLALLGAGCSAGFSAYMAYVSLVWLGAVCIQCIALYLVTACLAVVAWRSSRLFDCAWPSLAPLLSATSWWAGGALCVLAVSAVAAWSWPSTDRMPLGMVSLEELQNADPDFYQWYTSLPVATLPQSLDLDRMGMGPATAAVTIIEFSDLECVYCRKNHKLLEALMERRPEEVRVLYRHFPLDPSCNQAVSRTVHRRACRAAEALECAGRQGRFNGMLDALFDNQHQLFETKLFNVAAGLRLDEGAFAKCMGGQETLATVSADARAGAILGLNSTPTLFINGRRVEGAFDDPWDYDYAVMIEARLAGAQARPATGSPLR